MKNKLVFIHGLESTSQGTKARYFRKHFPQMIIEDYTGDFKTRMRKLRALLNGQKNLILVGSSFGGLMAAQYALDHPDQVKKMVLIAPALTLEGFAEAVSKPLTMPVVIYHGRKDTVVDAQDVRRIAEKVFSRLDHHVVDDDHALNTVFPTLPWRSLLESD